MIDQTATTNSLFGGFGWAILLGAFGSVGYFYARYLLDMFIYRWLFFELSIAEVDDEYMWFNAYYSLHPYTIRGSSLVKPYKKSNASAVNRYNQLGAKEQEDESLSSLSDIMMNFNKVNFVPGIGCHCLYVSGQPMLVTLSITQNLADRFGNSSPKERVTILKPRYEWMKKIIRFFSPPVDGINNSPSVNHMLKQAGFKEEFLCKDIITQSCPDSNPTAHEVFKELLRDCYYVHTLLTREKTTIYSPFYQNWSVSCIKEKREQNSVILAEGVWEDLYNDIAEFLRAKKWYKSRGIPYRRGFLLYGPPGNGKTSSITSLAACFNLNICVLNMGAKSITDDNLMTLFSSAPTNSIIVLEDIDSAFKSDKDKEKKVQTDEEKIRSVIETTNKATFSCLLNCLDGIGSQESRIVFMTTNFKDRLPASLIRNGRIDRKIYLGNTTEVQCKRLTKNFYSDEYTEEKGELLWSRLKDYTFCMAQLQGFFLQNRRSINDVLEASNSFGEFLTEGKQDEATVEM